ncbi:MAG: AAA domain-containing protein [Proteobacteria bacterium]|nr:AAA domain-containing protein [Pseudomonadota bacterium]MCP4919903.1 AAA domain-containing protein [Pseudomonadota bacterium]
MSSSVETSELGAWLGSVGADAAFMALVEALGGLTDHAVFAVDGERRVTYWSPGAEQMLGFAAEDVVGRSCLESNRCVPCLRGCGVAEHRAIEGVDQTLHHADGEPVSVRKWARAFYDGDRFLGAVEVLSPSAHVASEHDAVESFHGLFSVDPAMKRAFELLRSVAPSDVSVLIRGESGTGKELAARAVHEESHRRDRTFLAVNCAALSPALLESELFGHVRGAFTGAVRSRDGLFKQADGGTLFLDEVAELPQDLQAKLLRVLQEQTFTPVGGTTSIKVDVRIVAATHTGLRARVADGRFRQDLMYRLRVVPIFIPSLRERPADVELLLWHFIRARNERGPRHIDGIAPSAMRALMDHGWPGNVRELMNVVQYAFAVGRGAELTLDELPPEFREVVARRPQPVDEAARIRRALEETGGSVGKAAALLGMSRPTFWRKRKKHGI